MGIGNKIRTIRERRGITQEELARRLGVTPSAVGNYERDVSHPKEEILYRLFTALSCEPNEIFADYYNSELTPSQIHLARYEALDEHGKELVDACTEIEYIRCTEGLTSVAARSFKKSYGGTIRLKKRDGAGSIFTLPDDRKDKL